jgi:anti-sigma B factor antagonist
MSATQNPVADRLAAIPPEAMLRFERDTSTASTVVLRIVGELDMFTTPTLREALRAELEPGQRVEVDLAGITFLGSHCIQMLLDAHHVAQIRGAELTITGAAHRAVARPLNLTGVDKVLPLVESPQATVA